MRKKSCRIVPSVSKLLSTFCVSLSLSKLSAICAFQWPSTLRRSLRFSGPQLPDSGYDDGRLRWPVSPERLLRLRVEAGRHARTNRLLLALHQGPRARGHATDAQGQGQYGKVKVTGKRDLGMCVWY